MMRYEVPVMDVICFRKDDVVATSDGLIIKDGYEATEGNGHTEKF